MCVMTVRYLGMQGHAAMQGKSPEEFLDKGGIECADLLVALHHIIMKMGAVGEIDGDPGQGFIHRQCAVTVAVDGAEVAEGGFERLAEADSHIFNCVMCIDFQIACCLDGEIKKTVDGKKCQHVVEKRNASVQGGLAFSVNGET